VIPHLTEYTLPYAVSVSAVSAGGSTYVAVCRTDRHLKMHGDLRGFCASASSPACFSPLADTSVHVQTARLSRTPSRSPLAPPAPPASC
jgi:hypothetical protein